MCASTRVLAGVGVVLSLGCQPPPSEVTDGSGAPTGDPLPTSTDAASTTSPADGSTAGGIASGSASTSLGTADSSSGTDASDASTGEPADEPLGPFGEPEAVVELNSFAAEDDPSLTADMLEIYFASTRGGSEDVWMSRRASVRDTWDAPVLVEVVSSAWQETFPEVSADGLVLLLASDRAGLGDLDVYYSLRASRGAPWSPPLSLAGAATPGRHDWGATLDPAMTHVLLCRDVAGGLGQSDIWQAPVDLGVWMVGVAVHVPELSSSAADCSASISASGREIFFESTRPAGPVFGWNLWVATRADTGGPWDEPSLVAELSSDADDLDPWLSPDRRTLWFASNRIVGHNELYVATRR
jgi:hypothetical protein